MGLGEEITTTVPWPSILIRLIADQQNVFTIYAVEKRPGEKSILLAHFCVVEHFWLELESLLRREESQNGDKARSIRHRFNCLYFVNYPSYLFKYCYFSHLQGMNFSLYQEIEHLNLYFLTFHLVITHCYTIFPRGVRIVLTCLLAAIQPWIEIHILS